MKNSQINEQNTQIQELTMEEMKQVNGGSPDSFHSLGAAIADYMSNGSAGSSLGARHWNACWQVA